MSRNDRPNLSIPISVWALVVLVSWIPNATVRGQDSLRLASALQRADRYYDAMGPRPQPTSKWIGEDRFAYSPGGSAPWTIIEAATGKVISSDTPDAAVGGPGPGFRFPLGLSYFGADNPASPNSGPWVTQVANGNLIVLDNAGATRLKLQGAQNYEWSIPPLAWNRDHSAFVATRVDSRDVHTVPIV